MVPTAVFFVLGVGDCLLGCLGDLGVSRPPKASVVNKFM